MEYCLLVSTRKMVIPSAILVPFNSAFVPLVKTLHLRRFSLFFKEFFVVVSKTTPLHLTLIYKKWHFLYANGGRLCSFHDTTLDQSLP